MRTPSTSLADLLFRVHSRGLVVQDPLDFAWKFARETIGVPAARRRPDRGLGIYNAALPSAIRLAPTVQPEWDAATTMLGWRYNCDVSPDNQRGWHPWTPRQDYHPDHGLLLRLPTAPTVAMCRPTAPYPEVGLRRYGSWLEGIHAIVLDGRLDVVNEVVLVTVTRAGPWEEWAGHAGEPGRPRPGIGARLTTATGRRYFRTSRYR